MNAAEIKSIIDKNREGIAFVIGNGINRYPDNPASLSWDELLMRLWDRASFQTLSRMPAGISLTEFYDIMAGENRMDLNLPSEICSMLGRWTPGSHHYRISAKIRELDVPLLTTNFDSTLLEAAECRLYRFVDKKGFSDYYPWSCYYAPEEITAPGAGFAVWHINGMLRYPRSIRLGLAHYMGSVARAKNLIQKGGNKLYSTRAFPDWSGADTWLDILFHKSLFIFGIALEENETFLRWLIIERMKYYRKYPERKQKGWYLCTPSCCGEGKRFFLEKNGIEILEATSYSDIYETIWE